MERNRPTSGGQFKYGAIHNALERESTSKKSIQLSEIISPPHVLIKALFVPCSCTNRWLLLVQQFKSIYLPAVLKLCPGIDSYARLAAIIDFCYNLGAGNLASSTLRRKINAGKWSDVPQELLKWNRDGGRVLRGLTLRRQTEETLI